MLAELLRHVMGVQAVWLEQENWKTLERTGFPDLIVAGSLMNKEYV